MALTLGILLAVLLLGAAGYVFARFRYAVEGEDLVLRWFPLGFLPLPPWRIPLRRIERLRRLRPGDHLRNAVVYGRLTSRSACILELKAERGRRFRLVYLTPEDPGALAAALPGSPFD